MNVMLMIAPEANNNISPVLVFVIGLVVVFSALILIVFLTKLMSGFVRKFLKDNAPAKKVSEPANVTLNTPVVPAGAAAAAAPVPTVLPQPEGDELIAVAVAAIAASKKKPPMAFGIKSIKKVK